MSFVCYSGSLLVDEVQLVFVLRPCSSRSQDTERGHHAFDAYRTAIASNFDFGEDSPRGGGAARCRGDERAQRTRGA